MSFTNWGRMKSVRLEGDEESFGKTKVVRTKEERRIGQVRVQTTVCNRGPLKVVISKEEGGE